MAVAVMFSACNKDQDGVYNPGKKIQKIYTVDETGAQQLEEVWHWNGDLLSSVDYYLNGILYYTNNFTYDGNRLMKISNSASYATFSYDGKKIDEIKCYEEGQEEPSAAYSFDYKGNKLSEVEIEFNYGGYIVDKKAMVNPLQFVLPQSCESVVKMIAKRANEVKADEKVIMKLTWKGGNVTTVDAEYEIQPMKYASTYTTQCTFDNKENPYKGSLASLAYGGVGSSTNMFCNSNNILTEITTSGDISITTDYSYQYADDYPVQVTYSTTYNLSSDLNEVETIVYEYE